MRQFGSGHRKGNKIGFSPILVADFCGSFVLPFLLAVSLSFSTWEIRIDACISGQATGGHSLLWLRLRLDCACHGNGGEMPTVLITE